MLSIEQVEHIAKLARLELSEDEKKLYATQLSSIIEFIEKLNLVNTDGVLETSQVTGLVNSVRADKINEASSELINGILNNAPDKEENLFKVKSVFE